MITDVEETYQEYVSSNKVFGSDGTEATVDKNTGVTRTVVVLAEEEKTETEPSFQELFTQEPEPVPEPPSTATEPEPEEPSTPVEPDDPEEWTNSGDENTTEEETTNQDTESDLDTKVTVTTEFTNDGSGTISETEEQTADFAFGGFAAHTAAIGVSLFALMA